jgi:DNA-binding GntR family transcriptional regulator
MKPRYRAIADTLRERIDAGAYPVGSKLPSITELQHEFDVPGLNTIRQAQQILVVEGLLETQQGVGAWVRAQSTPVGEYVDPIALLKDLRNQIERAIDLLEKQQSPAAV